ncbi:hypothetical protein [Nocardia yamanashiensis]|uniref:hypothetical protein n=1 Tax=Nocardia yamanashiensis TaxID=209247 RepID=UPI00082E8496|nr:hypothetical protein [Nocardia yamanashiensis]
MTTTHTMSPAEITAAAEADFEPVPLSDEAAAELRARLAASKTGRVLWPIDPRHVDVRRNVRNAATGETETEAPPKIDREYVESVREELLQLPVAFLLEDNTVRIYDGQRRTLAARAAKLPVIEYVVRLPKDGEALQRAAELVGGVKANNERQELTDEQVYQAQEELAGLDLPAKVKAKALKDLGIGAKQARAIRALRGAGKARQVAISGQLDLVQAVEAQEFENDPKAMARLVAAAKRDTFSSELAVLREARRVAALIEEAAAPYAKRGFRILPRAPYSSEREKLYVPIEDLRTPEGDPVTEADIAAAQWAVHLEISDRTVDAATGEPVEEDRIDQDTYRDPAREAAEGMYHAEQVRTAEYVEVSYYCLDFKRAGLRKPKTVTSAKSTELNGKAVGILNKQAKLETLARRTFVAEWLSRIPRTVPTDVQMWRMRLEASAPEIFNEYSARATACALLDTTTAKLEDGKIYHGLSLARAQMISIGLAMGAIEGRMHPREDKPIYWRISAPQAGVFWTVDMTLSRPYLRQLIALGYAPGIVERLTLGEITPAQALEAIATGTPAADIPATAENADEHQDAEDTPADEGQDDEGQDDPAEDDQDTQEEPEAQPLAEPTDED